MADSITVLNVSSTAKSSSVSGPATVDRVPERFELRRGVLGRRDTLGVDFRDAERRRRANADAQLARVGADFLARTVARVAAPCSSRPTRNPRARRGRPRCRAPCA